MPAHRQVTECRHGGPLSKFCGCEHCCLSVCSVCGSWEGGLTTDCPGERVPFEKQEEVYKTDLDFTDTLGWHHDGNGMKARSPRFAP